MNRPSISPAILALAVLTLPFVTGGQTRFFGGDQESQIIRKAKRYNLVSVKKEVPGSFIDMRYKITSAANKPLYLKEMPCLVHRSTAQKLKKANAILGKSGYAIKVWDAWRPPEAHHALWNAVRDPKYVVPPSKGLSWHCYGISIDLTLVKSDGTPVAMPSKFDEFSDRAASDYRGGDPGIAERVNLLQQTMRSVGFRVIESEWWHFDDMAAQGGIRNITAADLGIRMP
ncbi:M15 family metallopeptidase [Verrucomicrobiales bacterium]|jgi:D-alanyl-D-alanine dipeptidase|nr:M15 family metallopeptidase [Verrucomicrobiales bacterium]|tara:strand:+ start:379 stop:1065 length:687 start_codon:yes stop_codon:yes gene_type:complete